MSQISELRVFTPFKVRKQMAISRKAHRNPQAFALLRNLEEPRSFNNTELEQSWRFIRLILQVCFCQTQRYEWPWTLSETLIYIIMVKRGKKIVQLYILSLSLTTFFLFFFKVILLFSFSFFICFHNKSDESFTISAWKPCTWLIR